MEKGNVVWFLSKSGLVWHIRYKSLGYSGNQCIAKPFCRPETNDLGLKVKEYTNIPPKGQKKCESCIKRARKMGFEV